MMQKQLTLKIIIIFCIGFAILIPTTMVKSKIYERQSQLETAKHRVAQSWTGEQLLMTPILVIPYQVVSTTKHKGEEKTKIISKQSVFIPDTVNSNILVTNKTVMKGIYKIPVYDSDIHFSGRFSQEKLSRTLLSLKNKATFKRFKKPYISIYISDTRGIDQAPSLTFSQNDVSLSSGSQLDAIASGLHGEVGLAIERYLTGEPSIKKTAVHKPSLNFSFNLSLRGMSRLSVVPLTNNGKMTIESNWPHPEFIGASLPADRTISDDGFTASWLSTQYASDTIGLLQRCVFHKQCQALTSLASGVNFIEAVDIYLQSERSIKYAILFIGLSFITFFIFEHLKRVRIHPIQYTFVGLAIAVFYLLLISLAEHVDFYLAYLLATSCCSLLLIFYVSYVLKALSSACLFGSMISLLYLLLYIIVQAEDFALLMGAILVFGILSSLMVITRKIDWYNLELPDAPKQSLLS